MPKSLEQKREELVDRYYDACFASETFLENILKDYVSRMTIEEVEAETEKE